MLTFSKYIITLFDVNFQENSKYRRVYITQMRNYTIEVKLFCDVRKIRILNA